VIERLEPDPDILAVHFLVSLSRHGRLVRPSTSNIHLKSWMPGTTPGMTTNRTVTR